VSNFSASIVFLHASRTLAAKISHFVGSTAVAPWTAAQGLDKPNLTPVEGALRSHG